jgi:hypothetical protein
MSFRYVGLWRSVTLICNICAAYVRTSIEKDVMVASIVIVKVLLFVNMIYGCNDYIYMLCVY